MIYKLRDMSLMLSDFIAEHLIILSLRNMQISCDILGSCSIKI